VIIPNSVITIDDYAFKNCHGLEEVTIPPKVIIIGECAFHYCYRLKIVTITNNVATIGKCAFSSCPNLQKVVIPNSVTTIGDYAFLGCPNLTEVTIPSGVKSVGKPIFSNNNNVVFELSVKLRVDYFRCSYATFNNGNCGNCVFDKLGLFMDYLSMAELLRLTIVSKYTNAIIVNRLRQNFLIDTTAVETCVHNGDESHLIVKFRCNNGFLVSRIINNDESHFYTCVDDLDILEISRPVSYIDATVA